MLTFLFSFLTIVMNAKFFVFVFVSVSIFVSFKAAPAAAPAAPVAAADDDDDDDDLFGDDEEEEVAKPAEKSRAEKMAEAKSAKDANKKVDR